MMKVGRNDPCPCGSGEKYKRCCMDKQLRTPPSGAHCAHCGSTQVKAGFGCDYCPNRYHFCAEHAANVRILAEGHVARVHPEKVPEAMAKLAASPRDLADLRRRAAERPDLWGAQLVEVEKHVVRS